MVLSSIQQQGGYYDLKGNWVSLGASAPKTPGTKNPDGTTNTPTGTYNPYTNTYTDDPSKTSPIGGGSTTTSGGGGTGGSGGGTTVVAPTFSFTKTQIDKMLAQYGSKEKVIEAISQKSKNPFTIQSFNKARDAALGAPQTGQPTYATANSIPNSPTPTRTTSTQNTNSIPNSPTPTRTTSTQNTNVVMPDMTPPPQKSTGSAPVSGGSGADSWNGMFNKKQVDMLMGKYTSREEAMRQLTKATLARGKTREEAKAVAAAFDKALGFFSTQNNVSSTKQPENPSSIIPPKTGIKSADEAISREEQNRQRDLSVIEDTKNKSMEYNAISEKGEKEKQENIRAILKQREEEAGTSFNFILGKLKELESNANNALDLNTIQSINERNRQLAARGLLTAAQAGGASAMMTEQFRQEAEKKRLDIMSNITEKMIVAEQERARIIDTIRSDQILAEKDKQEGIERINGIYMNIIGNYGEQYRVANNEIDKRIGVLLQTKSQMDADIMLEKAKKELEVDFSLQDRERIKNDPEYRMDYILKKLGEIDANTAREGAILLQSYIQDGRFNTMSTIELLAEIQKQAAINAKAYETGGSSGGGGGGGGGSSGGGGGGGGGSTSSGTYTQPYQPVTNTNALVPTLDELAKLSDVELMQQGPEVFAQVKQYQNTLQANESMATNGVQQPTDLTQQTLYTKLSNWLNEFYKKNPNAVRGAAIGSVLPAFGTAVGGAIGYGIDKLTQ